MVGFFSLLAGGLGAVIGGGVGGATSAGPLKGSLVGGTVAAVFVGVSLASDGYFPSASLSYLAGGVAAAAAGVYVASKVESHPMSDDERKEKRKIATAISLAGLSKSVLTS